MDNSTNTHAELIKIIPQHDRLSRWQPIVGDETLALMDHLASRDPNPVPRQELSRIQEEAVGILSKCVPPMSLPEQATGLVIGYVQSGKTMSFTTVTALTRDNGYQIVIVIAGTSIPLLDQSTDRLKRDLRLDTRQDRKWLRLESRSIEASDCAQIESALAEWQDATIPASRRRTILITVMKHHKHLQDVCDILAKIKNLSAVPVIVIDDEADQASLNAKVNQGDVSTTYERILKLKDHLPHHTFLQYTATPQAPLLINLIDVLSPRFVEVLTPGDGYIGGKDFFVDANKFVCPIPTHEIATKNSPLNAPPDSLLYALRLFFVGVAAGLIMEAGRGNRSMMVHPSKKTAGHQENFEWIQKIQKNWLSTLESSDRREILEDFKRAYDDILTTVPQLAPFDKLANRLPEAIRGTFIKEVNTRGGKKTPLIDWKNNYTHILVGGQAMDRGFTVEGLTVTYMPRYAGVGNADTIQQRARFFGYKKGYFGYCRVFLENDVKEAFKSYVRHEEDIRNRLIEHRDTGTSLAEWKRAFFLDQRLKPTRRNVLDLDYMRGDYANDWYTPKAPHDSTEAVNHNCKTVEEFLSKHPLQEDENEYNRRLENKHQKGIFPLDIVYSQLLVPYRLTRSGDSQHFTGLLLQIAFHLEHSPDAVCAVYKMGGGKSRKRETNDRNEIKQLFEGRRPKVGTPVYPGDREFKEEQIITVQIHTLRVEQDQSNFINNVPTIAVWVPQDMSREWLVQEQGGAQ